MRPMLRRCFNGECGKTGVEEWRKGWPLKSGGFANLCPTCGMAYEKSTFCDLFHLKESGWRECSNCGKRLHCGCAASSSFIVLLDDGGVECINCLNKSGLTSAQAQAFLDSLLHCSAVSGRASHDNAPNHRSSSTEGINNFQSQKNILDVQIHDTNATYNHTKHEEIVLSVRDLGPSCFSRLNQIGNCSRTHSRKQDETFETTDPGCFHRVQQIHPDVSMDPLSHPRTVRPSGEGRGRNNLLLRYWPRITEQELKQMSGDSNSTIVPLFDKVLSASDAGRIGRLVLPKACAEAYLPPISQPEGLPLKIQDAKGRDWVFQFRFWPNNNSRMYVLEGVTSCIQSMQLQAGDTVTFSRIEPEGKLLMGFRKATNSSPFQDSQISSFSNGKESFLSGVIENLQSSHAQGKRRSRNITSKRKRLRMESEDALELKVDWEEAQELLCAPPNATPSVVVIEDYEFEEFEEPPVLGKKTIFSARTSGVVDQWVQCNDCHKFRRLPPEAVVLSEWVCNENLWDTERSSCSVPSELGESEIKDLLLQSADFRRNLSKSRNSSHPLEDVVTTFPGSDAALTAFAAATMTTRHPRHRPGCTCIVCIQPPSGKGPKHEPDCLCNVCITVRRRFNTLMLRKKQRQSELLSDPCSTTFPPELVHLDLNSAPERGVGDGHAHIRKMSSLNLVDGHASSSSTSAAKSIGSNGSNASDGCFRATDEDDL